MAWLLLYRTYMKWQLGLKLVAVAFGVSLFLASCTHVRPWQREHMARIEKQLDGDAPQRSYEAKMWAVREGASGGTGKAGGGCGCN